MIRKVFAAVAVLVMVLGILGSFIAMGQGEAPRVGSNPLVAMLPASDAVVVGDGKRFFTEGPKVLAANQRVLGELLGKLDEVQAKTGIDLRKFETFAAGVSMAKSEGHGHKVAPVAIARGSIDSAQVIEAAKKMAEGKAKEVSVNGRTMYVVAAKDAMELAKKHAPASANHKKIEDKVAQHTMEDLAIAAADGNTVVFGYASRVRETLEAKSKVSDDLLALLAKKPAGIANFAAKVPGGMGSLLPLDNDELGAVINSIKAVYGAADVANGQAVVNLTGVTGNASQAEELRGTLDGLKVLGKSFLGASKAADKQLYARLIDSVKISSAGNELSLDLAIPQNDIDAIVAILKK